MTNKKNILEILSTELEIDINSINTNDPFAGLENMDSLTQVSIINTIEQELEIEFDFDDLFDIEVVQDLLDLADSKLS